MPERLAIGSWGIGRLKISPAPVGSFPSDDELARPEQDIHFVDRREGWGVP